MFGTGGFEKNINVVVGGNATGYVSALTMATSVTKAFKIGVAAAGAAVVVFSGVMLKKAVSAAADFEQAMAGVKAVTQATPAEFDKLIKKAKELGRVTKFTMMDIAAGEEALGRAGFTTNEIISSMDGVAAMAAASGISLGEAADYSAKTIRALGLAASDSTRVADVFAHAAASANLDVTMLAESMKYIAPLARAAGYSLEETVAAVSKLGDVGIQGSMAGTSLRFAFSELLAETDGFAESLDELGMSMDDITGPDGKLMGFIEILGILEEAGADTGAIIDMMGKRAGPAVAALLQNVPGLREFAEELDNVEGAAKKMADIRLDTLRGQLEVLQGSWQLMLVTVGEKIIPIIQEFVEDTLIPAVNEFAAWAEESDALEKGLESLFEALTNGFKWMIDNGDKVINTLKGIGTALIVMTAANIISGLTKLGLAIKGVGVAVTMMNPTAVAAFIAIAGGYGIYKGGEAIYNALADAVENVGDQMGDLRDNLNPLTRETRDSMNAAETMKNKFELLTMSLDNAQEMMGITDIELADMHAAIEEVYAAMENAPDTDAALKQWNRLIDDILLSWSIKFPQLTRLMTDSVSSLAVAVDNAWATTFGSIGAGVFDLTPPSLVPQPTLPGQLGPTVAAAAGLPTCPGGVCDVDDYLDDTTSDIIATWQDSMDELRDVMTETPTQATAELQAFMAEFGAVPAALLAGSGAARSILSDLEELQRMGVEGLAGDIAYLEGIVGITAQEAADAAQKALDDAKEATEQAKRDADDLAAKQEEAARNAADAMRDAFESKFTEPIAQALATGNWEEAAQAVQSMAQSFPELTAEAAQVSEVLKAVGMEGISQLDVLQALNGMGPSLISTLEGVIKLAEDAGDLDLAKELRERLDNLFSDEDTWKEKTSEWLDKGWSGAIDAALSMLPGNFSALAKGLFDTFKTALTDPIGAITSALGVAQMAIQMFYEGLISRLQDKLDDLREQDAALREQESELLEAMAFYVSTLRAVGSLLDGIFNKFGIVGKVASATMNAFISSIEMLTLEGFDLLRAGVKMLTNFIGSLINAVMGLIEKSDAYQAVQSEGQRAWKAISDLFGQFLWPLAALLKHIMDWLGIQTEANAQAAAAVEIGVPAMFKRELRAYESAAPGEIFATAAVSGGTEIPAWASEIVEGIAEAIENMLKGFGIDSWADLLEKFKAGSIQFWNYVTANIPQLISSLSAIFSTLSSALGGGVVDTIVNWLKRGFDWLINEAPGAVRKVVDFIGDLFDLAGDTLAWFEENLDWDKIRGMIDEKFNEFRETLALIETPLDKIPDKLDEVRLAIDGVADKISEVESQIRSLKTTMTVAMITVGAGIIGAIVGIPGFKIATALAFIGGGLILSGLLGKLGAFADGGMVPGPIGSPSLNILHGGEQVLTPAQQRQGSGTTVVEIYLGGENVTDWIVERVQHKSKYQTGRYATANGLTGRY